MGSPAVHAARAWQMEHGCPLEVYNMVLPPPARYPRSESVSILVLVNLRNIFYLDDSIFTFHLTNTFEPPSLASPATTIHTSLAHRRHGSICIRRNDLLG